MNVHSRVVVACPLLTRLVRAQCSALTLVGESDRKLVKLAMKHAPPESIKQRTIPADVVGAVSKELRNMEPEVKAVVMEEREEKEVSHTQSAFDSQLQPGIPAAD